jgi:hypothetical protein
LTKVEAARAGVTREAAAVHRESAVVERLETEQAVEGAVHAVHEAWGSTDLAKWSTDQGGKVHAAAATGRARHW